MFYALILVIGSTVGARYILQVLRSRTHFGRYRGRQVPFSYFALPDPFLAVSRASGPVFMFCAPRPISGGTEGGGGSHFNVLRTQTRIGRYRGCRLLFSYFTLTHLFWAVPSEPGPVFIFCARRPVLSGTVGVGSHFNVWRSRNHFGRYRGRRVPFSCFALPDPYWALPSASGPVFMFCALELVFGGTLGVGSRFNFLRSRNRFEQYRVRRVSF
jgi:uncharacterized protein (DUF3820 family)